MTWYLTPPGHTVGAWYGQTNLPGDNVRDLNIIMSTLYYCQLSVTNPDWQLLLGSGDDRTIRSLAGPVLAGMVPSPGPYTARLELSHYSSTGQRRQTHFITSNIILNARYRGAEDVSCHAGFSSYERVYCIMECTVHDSALAIRAFIPSKTNHIDCTDYLIYIQTIAIYTYSFACASVRNSVTFPSTPFC